MGKVILSKLHPEMGESISRWVGSSRDEAISGMAYSISIWSVISGMAYPSPDGPARFQTWALRCSGALFVLCIGRPLPKPPHKRERVAGANVGDVP